jgi:para-nitrobenzyl esterase
MATGSIKKEEMNSSSSIVTCLAALGLACVPMTSLRAQDLPPGRQSITVRTHGGDVVGTSSQGVQVFRAIPYAEPPIGALRFRRAVPMKSWSRPRDASAPGPACFQVLDLDDPAEDGDRVMSEDCLTVNIWAPQGGAANRAVMVFIHGGGFEEGSAADSWYDGATLAKKGDVVVVTLQYRLGALGFLELSGLRGGDSFLGSGNIGLLDQVQALRWVRENVRAFGGDPDNVTIFGESAGGASVRALMALPEARDLFEKAIVESGDGHFIPLTHAAEIGRAFAKLAGANNVSDLQRLPAEALMRAQDRLFSSGYGSMPFGPVADGHVFSRSPAETLAADPSLSKPLLIGTNEEEMRYWVAMDANGIERQPEAPFRKRLQTIFGPGADDLLDVYRGDCNSLEEAIPMLIGDAVFRLPSIRLAEINAPRQPTYMYLFGYRSQTRGQTGLEYGAMHGLEIAFVFQLDTTQGYLYVGPKGSWRHLSDQMVQAWTHFARSGNPNGPLLPAWPPYDTALRATLKFAQHSDVVLDPYGVERRAWANVSTGQLDSYQAVGLADVASAGDH